ncbi:MAG TPA: transposase [Acidimicrobiia bacterium]|nr:transposase [Acidimicrobiia bacterium]
MDILRPWERTVKGQLLPDLHAHQAKALAAVSVGMARSGHCDSGRVSAAMPGAARAASARRRVERAVANGRVRPDRAQGDLARAVLGALAACPGRRLVLILDETPCGGRLNCLKVSVGYRRRAIPLAWECYPPDDPPVPMPKLIWRLLGRVARWLRAAAGAAGAAVEVTLLADRGLSWPTVVDGCRHVGWHYVLRLQGSVRVRTAGGTERSARDLAPRKGARWFGTGVAVFKKAGWRAANVVATWEDPCKEPWLLVTDLPATFARCRGYCKRTWCEQLHRDEKSQGFNWQRSLVRDPARARRLLLAVALATILAVCTGTWVLKRGLRRVLESTRRRKLSIFQLGLRWLTTESEQASAPPCSLYLLPT